MRAEEARNLFEKAQEENANKWYEEFKEEIFAAIKRQAESRSESLTIGTSDTLNKFDFISYSPLRNKLKEELEKLGYKFSYSDHREGDYITISW